MVDTLGLLLVMVVTAANIQDRDGGARVLERLRFAMPSVATIFADGGYAGRLVAYARQRLRIAVEVVRKPADQQGFAVLPRRWVVERTLGWIVRCRRLDHDYERLPATAAAWTKWAMIGIMTRRLAPGPGRRPWHPPVFDDPISNTLLHNANHHRAVEGPVVALSPLRASLADSRPSCRDAVLDAVGRLRWRTGATEFTRRDIVAEVRATDARFERQTIYRCLRRMTGRERGSAHHDLADLGDDRLRVRS